MSLQNITTLMGYAMTLQIRDVRFLTFVATADT
jgi:hypothetical protein